MSYLFFSNYCKYSIELLNLLQNTTLNNKFKLVCIDGISNHPSFLKVVPTLYIDSKIIEGQSCKQYIESNSKPLEKKIEGTYLNSNMSFSNIDGSEHDTSFSYINKSSQSTIPTNKMKMSETLKQMDFNKKLEELQQIRNEMTPKTNQM